MSIVLTVNNNIESIFCFVVPDMSLSSAKAEMKKLNFKISIEREDFVNSLEHNYQKLIVELQPDENNSKITKSELSKAKYPSLLEVTKSNLLLNETIGIYLFEEFVIKYNQPNVNTKFWYESVSHCTLNESTIEIYGHCYGKEKKPNKSLKHRALRALDSF